VRPVVSETTALGAAYAAGLAVGFWSGTEELRRNWAEDKTFHPAMEPLVREKFYRQWRKAVERTFNWVD
jgi:glycerol kinase